MKARKLTISVLAVVLAALALAPAAQAQFDLQQFRVVVAKPDGTPATQSGSHDFTLTTSFNLPFGGTAITPIFEEKVRDVLVEQIEGMVGDSTAVPQCEMEDFMHRVVGAGDIQCSRDTIVGIQSVSIGQFSHFESPAAVYNLEPPRGAAARLGWKVRSFPILLDVGVKGEPGYNLVAASRNVNQTLGLMSALVQIWGVPADPAHDSLRSDCAAGAQVVNRTKFVPGSSSCPAGMEPRAYLTLPRACQGVLSARYQARSWSDSAPWATGSWPATQGLQECESLAFDPQVSAAPTTNVAASPSGFDFAIEIDDPGLTDPDGRAASDLKKAVVTLPPGVTVNAAAAGGLDACTAAQLTGETADSAPGAGCPQTSKVADVHVETPLLHEQLHGSIYLATPYQNPLGTLLAGYLVIKQPERGIAIKLAGKIETDPNTGRITASFDQNPQLPFSDLQVSFFGGAKGPLTTPSVCGDYEVRTELHPWSGNAADISTQPFAIAQGAGGGPCATSAAALPHSPGFDAGSVTPIAGAHSSFVVNLRREDGTQRFKDVTLSPPPGLTAKLAGTAICSDGALAAAASRPGVDEQGSPSCPASSRIGGVFAAAGSGPAPYWAPGTAYLTGPYKGAPLSMAIVTPAVAGPFDLGTVVIRTALHIDPVSAEITAVSDPIPEFLQGIPLDVRQAIVRLDKPDFALNGTSCDPMAVTGLLTSTLGAVANLHSRFQLGECARLGFKPKMVLRLKGGTLRGAHPQLTAIVAPRAGDANIASVSVAFPRSEFLENAHIRTICTRPDFAADRCPKGAVYGRSVVHTPLLDYPLVGNVYLRSSDNLLPDLVPDLRGPAHQPIRVEAAGRTDSVRGGIRNTFDFFPDAPFSRAALKMRGGDKGLLVNSRDICRRTYRAKVVFTAHNGLRRVIRPKLVAQGCKKRKAKRGGHKRKGKRGAKRSAVALRGAVR